MPALVTDGWPMNELIEDGCVCVCVAQWTVVVLGSILRVVAVVVVVVRGLM